MIGAFLKPPGTSVAYLQIAGKRRINLLPSVFLEHFQALIIKDAIGNLLSPLSAVQKDIMSRL